MHGGHNFGAPFLVGHISHRDVSLPSAHNSDGKFSHLTTTENFAKVRVNGRAFARQTVTGNLAGGLGRG